MTSKTANGPGPGDGYAIPEQFTKRVINDQAYRHWALRRLHLAQTPAEKAYRVTRALNGVGFSAPDAPILSPLAEELLSGRTLTSSEETVLKWSLPKYWKQFV